MFAVAFAVRFATETATGVPETPMLPVVAVRFSVGVVIVAKLPLLMLVACKEIEVVPVTDPLRLRLPAEVNCTTSALMVPAALLVRLPAVVFAVKFVPALDAPEMFIAAALVRFTSPLAFALTLADPTI